MSLVDSAYFEQFPYSNASADFPPSHGNETSMFSGIIQYVRGKSRALLLHFLSIAFKDVFNRKRSGVFR